MLKKGYLQSFAGTDKLSANSCNHPSFQDRGVASIKRSITAEPETNTARRVSDDLRKNEPTHQWVVFRGGIFTNFSRIPAEDAAVPLLDDPKSCSHPVKLDWRTIYSAVLLRLRCS